MFVQAVTDGCSSQIMLVQEKKKEVLYVNIFIQLHLRVENVQWIESQCISRAERIVLISDHEWNESSPPPISTMFYHFILFHLMHFKALFFYTQELELKLPKKECMQNILVLSVPYSAKQPWELTENCCASFPVRKHRFNSFWVTANLFVLCSFVRLFLNVYTWFSNCLFCTFIFINQTVQAFPMVSWRPYC